MGIPAIVGIGEALPRKTDSCNPFDTHSPSASSPFTVGLASASGGRLRPGIRIP
jgi:hypothetical protein